jgi:hypothetical protein
MKNVITAALIGAIVGVLIAQFFPNIGQGRFASHLGDLGFALGAEKPYLKFGGFGAIVGAVVGLVNGKS